ncbi:MAG: TldD/PmbA family protein [Thermoplasmatota archaeon]
MVGHDHLEDLAEKIFKKAEADEVEILVVSKDTALTRYANSKIHQNVAQVDKEVSIRAVIDKKVGSASTNAIDDKSVLDTLGKAETIAKHQKEDPHFKGLPKSKKDSKTGGKYCKETVEYTPENRAEKVKDIIDFAKDIGIDRVYGAFTTEEINLFVANTNGISKYDQITNANLTTTAIADWDNDQGFGWGETCRADVREIDHMEVAKTAVEKGIKNLNPKSIESGEYNVVLEPLAVKSMLMYMGFMGFSSRAVQEERSFMKGKFGEQIMNENVTIYDDALDEDMIGFSFDYEGVPKQRVNIIEAGIAKNVVYDSYTAGKEDDKKSTGHALPMPNPNSPIPLNLLMDSGDYSIREMIEETNNGILVTRFNYCRTVHPVKSILTGLTRDGTWLIEDGEVTSPVKNLRFTQNLLDAFSKVEAIGDYRDIYSLGYIPGYIATPAMKIPDFNFTGTTEF